MCYKSDSNPGKALQSFRGQGIGPGDFSSLHGLQSHSEAQRYLISGTHDLHLLT